MTLNAKSKRHVKKIIEKIYEDVLDDAGKLEQDKKTYLIDIINDPDERVKENRKAANYGDKESDIQAGKVVIDDDQDDEGKTNILREGRQVRKNN